jgi:hypothetical protein
MLEMSRLTPTQATSRARRRRERSSSLPALRATLSTHVENFDRNWNLCSLR